MDNDRIPILINAIRASLIVVHWFGKCDKLRHWRTPVEALRYTLSTMCTEHINPRHKAPE